MSLLKDRAAERQELKELISNANPALRVIGRGLVILVDDDSEETEEYKDLMESSDEILSNEPITEPTR